VKILAQMLNCSTQPIFAPGILRKSRGCAGGGRFRQSAFDGLSADFRRAFRRGSHNLLSGSQMESTVSGG